MIARVVWRTIEKRAKTATVINSTYTDHIRKDMQSNAVKALGMVLKDQIANGATIFQGAHPSPPLEMLLQRLGKEIKPYFVDLRDQKEVVEYRKEDQVISVETGMNAGELKALLAPNKQYLPCFVPDDLTLLEIINSAETGYFQHSFGVRSLVLGLDVLLSSGDRIKTGGKVVKNVSGYDLTKLFLGARGTLGIPTKAHLRVFARPEITEMFVATDLDFDSLLSLSNELIKSGLVLTGLELVSGYRQPPAKNSGNGNSNSNSSDKDVSSAFGKHYLLITVSEHADVMSELSPLVEGHCQRLGAKVEKLPPAAQTQLMTSIEKQFALSSNSLNFSASRSQYRKIFSAFSQSGVTQMLYRPGTGKLNLIFESADARRDGMALLGRISDGQSYDVAYADDEFEYRVERLPHADPEIEAIKRSLKERFDPLGRMNPLAKL